MVRRNTFGHGIDTLSAQRWTSTPLVGCKNGSQPQARLESPWWTTQGKVVVDGYVLEHVLSEILSPGLRTWAPTVGLEPIPTKDDLDIFLRVQSNGWGLSPANKVKEGHLRQISPGKVACGLHQSLRKMWRILKELNLVHLPDTLKPVSEGSPLSKDDAEMAKVSDETSYLICKNK